MKKSEITQLIRETILSELTNQEKSDSIKAIDAEIVAIKLRIKNAQESVKAAQEQLRLKMQEKSKKASEQVTM